MKTTFAIASLLLAVSVGSATAYASDDADVDRGQPKAFVKDSAITTKIKAKLAAEHLTSLARIKVDTDADGIVWLSGKAESQAEIDKAVSIARATDGVVSVKNAITVDKAD